MKGFRPFALALFLFLAVATPAQGPFELFPGRWSGTDEAHKVLRLTVGPGNTKPMTLCLKSAEGQPATLTGAYRVTSNKGQPLGRWYLAQVSPSPYRLGELALTEGSVLRFMITYLDDRGLQLTLFDPESQPILEVVLDRD